MGSGSMGRTFLECGVPGGSPCAWRQCHWGAVALARRGNNISFFGPDGKNPIFLAAAVTALSEENHPKKTHLQPLLNQSIFVRPLKDAL